MMQVSSVSPTPQSVKMAKNDRRANSGSTHVLSPKKTAVIEEPMPPIMSPVDESAEEALDFYLTTQNVCSRHKRA
jgi:hypothetical protein